MLSLQTSNDDLCWLVGLCPRTVSGIQGQSVPGRGGGSPAAPAARPRRGLSPLCHTPGNKGDHWPAKDSDTRYTDTWDCSFVVSVSHTDGLKGERHSPCRPNHRQGFHPIWSGTAPFIPEELHLFVTCWFLALRITFILPGWFFPYFCHFSTPSFPGWFYPPNQFCLFCMYAGFYLRSEANNPLSGENTAMEWRTVPFGTYKPQTSTLGQSKMW